MSDLHERTKKNEHEISSLFTRMNDISKAQEHFSDEVKGQLKNICHLKKSLKSINRNLEKDHMQQKGLINLIYIWISVAMTLVFGSFFLSYANGIHLKFLEVSTSWITFAMLVFAGSYASFLAYEKNKVSGYLVAVAWSLISTCYAGYTLINFGSLYPEVAAIGFNIASCAQTISILHVIYNLRYKNV